MNGATSTTSRRLIAGMLICGIVLVAIFVRVIPAAQGGLPGGPDPASAQPSTNAGSPSPEVDSLAPSPAQQTPGSTPSPIPSPVYPFVPIENGGTLSITPGAVADLKPGRFAPRPDTMSVQQISLPAPWTGGTATSVTVYVRLPDGYDPAHQRYPTVYVTPNPWRGWSNLFGLGKVIDKLETSGALPPMIYVFAPAMDGPYRVTQCLDSYDGTQHWDTFMSTTLVADIDSHYATLASAAARTILGFSQGGYCAADLLLRHPDVWHTSISFSGFYDAAPRVTNTTAGNAVYGGDQALMDAYSPITIAPQIPTTTRQQLFVVLAGLSSQNLFGPAMDRFSGVLDQAGYARALIETPEGHSWKSVEQFLPRALSLDAARLVKEGVIP